MEKVNPQDCTLHASFSRFVEYCSVCVFCYWRVPAEFAVGVWGHAEYEFEPLD